MDEHDTTISAHGQNKMDEPSASLDTLETESV